MNNSKMITKKWYQSKTIWVQIATFLATISGILSPDLLQAMGFENAVRYTVIVQGIGQAITILLRTFDTATPVESPFNTKEFNPNGGRHDTI